MFFNSCQMVYLLQNEISLSTHDFQHITKNCQTQSSLSRVENHVEEIKNYCDGNEMSDWCGLTSCTRWITMFTLKSDLENPEKPNKKWQTACNKLHVSNLNYFISDLIPIIEKLILLTQKCWKHTLPPSQCDILRHDSSVAHTSEKIHFLDAIARAFNEIQFIQSEKERDRQARAIHHTNRSNVFQPCPLKWQEGPVKVAGGE